ncbi:MAG: hypothetical protein AAF408_13770 [Pseudomonadota bacterium]
MKNTSITGIALTLSTALLSGCASPEQYETTPVKVITAKGVVTCQLYTTQLVLWDRAINRPENMTVAEADEICRQEGQRRLDGLPG